MITVVVVVVVVVVTVALLTGVKGGSNHVKYIA